MLGSASAFGGVSVLKFNDGSGHRLIRESAMQQASPALPSHLEFHIRAFFV